jgi:acyl-homoserine-lactone acylase
LKAAVTDLQAANVPPDARLGDVSSLTRQGERIPIHGGASSDGAYNVITFHPLAPNEGWTVNEGAGGSSYIMAVEFTAHGPESESVIVYSQSDNKDSKFYKDQTEVYSKYGWIKQYFRKEDVDRHTVTRQTISGN